MGAREDDRTQRILIGIGLIAVGLFTLLSLIPVDLFGEGAAALFPSGNIAGSVGAAVAGALVGSFGVSAGEARLAVRPRRIPRQPRAVGGGGRVFRESGGRRADDAVTGAS